jgi:hypothetical protein
MGATPTIYARSRDRWRAYTSNKMAQTIDREVIVQKICEIRFFKLRLCGGRY